MHTRFKRTAAVFGVFLCMILLFAGCGNSSVQDTEIMDLSDLNGKKIGLLAETSLKATVEDTLSQSQYVYYTSETDLFAALETEKIDAFLDYESAYYIMDSCGLEVDMFTVTNSDIPFSAMFSRTATGELLYAQFNEFLASAESNGQLDQIIQKWTESDSLTEDDCPDFNALSGQNGSISIAVNSTICPFTYKIGDTLAGIEMDLIWKFCDYYGYAAVINDMSADAFMPALSNGSCDLAIGMLTETEERAQQAFFSNPYYHDRAVFVVLGEDYHNTSLAHDLKEGFLNTFVREDRWKQLLSGISMTMEITVYSILFGAIIGFGGYLLCRMGKKKLPDLIARCVIHVIRGIPMVVLILIFYYIIFNQSDVEGKWISIFAFTLEFAAAVYTLVRDGVDSVSPGQREAALSLGYSPAATFFKIVLPQAAANFLPTFRSEITALILGTAVVGYVAVQDLTKISDLIRSQTYEAFFPLLATAFIYYALAQLLSWFCSWLVGIIVPTDRSRKHFLKGVHRNV